MIEKSSSNAIDAIDSIAIDSKVLIVGILIYCLVRGHLDFGLYVYSCEVGRDRRGICCNGSRILTCQNISLSSLIAIDFND